jgi:hypothetical protein
LKGIFFFSLKNFSKQVSSIMKEQASTKKNPKNPEKIPKLKFFSDLYLELVRA